MYLGDLNVLEKTKMSTVIDCSLVTSWLWVKSVVVRDLWDPELAASHWEGSR
jgi:hypothetical protein